MKKFLGYLLVESWNVMSVIYSIDNPFINLIFHLSIYYYTIIKSKNYINKAVFCCFIEEAIGLAISDLYYI